MTNAKRVPPKSLSRAERQRMAQSAARRRQRLEAQRAQAEEQYLRESNAILRMQLKIQDDRRRPPPPPGPPRSAPRHPPGHVPLPPDMARLLGKQSMQESAAVDLWDRVLSGDAGKGPPKDPEALRRWREAEAAAPKNQRAAARLSGPPRPPGPSQKRTVALPVKKPSSHKDGARK